MTICSYCSKENDPTAVFCIRCQRVLSVRDLTNLPKTTIRSPSPNQVPTRPMTPRTSHVGKMTDGQVGMYFGDEFLLVPVREKCVLGRGIAADYSQPTIDLSKYAALEKGVSRIHCALAWQGNTLTLEDLKSSNGTWLNSVRLMPFKPYPLESGEMILLGKLDIWVYYR